MFDLDASTPVPVQQFPAHMTGKLYRKAMGIPDKKSIRIYGEKSWRVAAKFRGVKRVHRLAFLKKMVKKGDSSLSLSAIQQKRREFDQNKLTHLPMTEDCQCYACPNAGHINKAVLRHHVIPLSKGGRNRRNNIVPLCNECHIKLHPHMQKKSKRLDLNGVVASRHCKPQLKGPLVLPQEDEKIIFVPAVGVTRPGLGVTASL